MIRHALVLLAATVMVGCTAATPAVPSQAQLEDMFATTVRDSLKTSGMPAATVECMIANMKSQLTAADYLAASKDDPAVMKKIADLTTAATTKCLTP